MTAEARVRAFAKLNLDLRVLYKRADGYHELRSIFQTISLADEIGIRFHKTRRTEIRTTGNIEIPDNLMVLAAQLCLEEMKVAGTVELELEKRIPMGAGLGGGSSDAAAVLLALPALAGKRIAIERLIPLAAKLGSDVPFFLLGGTAAGPGTRRRTISATGRSRPACVGDLSGYPCLYSGSVSRAQWPARGILGGGAVGESEVD